MVTAAEAYMDLHGIDLNAVILTEPSVEFDGRKFSQLLLHLPYLYFAYQARRGDKGAAELLTAFSVTILDYDNNLYWPMEDADKPVEVEAK